MKKSFLIGLVFLSFLFTGCDDKSAINESVIAKKTSENSYKFVPQTFNLLRTDGKLISLKSTENGLDFDEFKGKKAILVDIFATWCPPCIEGIPLLNEVREKNKDNFEIVSVLFEQDKTKEEILQFIAKHGVTYPITMGEENFKLAKELGDVKKVPEMYLISKNGKFIKKFVGKVPKEELEQYIKMAIEN